MGHAGISLLKEKAASDALCKGMVVAAWIEWSGWEHLPKGDDTCWYPEDWRGRVSGGPQSGELWSSRPQDPLIYAREGRGDHGRSEGRVGPTHHSGNLKVWPISRKFPATWNTWCTPSGTFLGGFRTMARECGGEGAVSGLKATKAVVADLLALMVKVPLKFVMQWNLLVPPHVRKFCRDWNCWGFSPGSCQATHLQAKFSKEVLEVASPDLRKFTAYLYQGKWSRFFHWCHGRNITPYKTTLKQLAEFFVYLQRELKFTVSAKGYQSALNYVFTLIGKEIATDS